MLVRNMIADKMLKLHNKTGIDMISEREKTLKSQKESESKQFK